jgi:hypothetical protein
VKKGTAYGSGSFADILHFFDETDGVVMGDLLSGNFEI